MIRVMVVDPSDLLNESTIQGLKLKRDIRVIDHTASAGEAQAKLSVDNCDVVLIAASLPEDGALALTRALHRDTPALKPVVVGLDAEQEVILRYVAAGAAAFVMSANSLDELLTTTRAVMQDKADVPPKIVMSMIQRIAALSRLSRQAHRIPGVSVALTEREQQVMALMAQEWCNQDIAEYLSIGVGTVKNHVHRILKKLNARNRYEAVSAHLAFTPS